MGNSIFDEERSFHKGDWVEIPKFIGQESVLTEAERVISGERQDSYGKPEDSFPIFAAYWQTYVIEKIRQACLPDIAECFVDLVIKTLKRKGLIDASDAANMMILFKQGRKLGQRPSRDNSVDSCGYEAIYADRLMKWDYNEKPAVQKNDGITFNDCLASLKLMVRRAEEKHHCVKPQDMADIERMAKAANDKLKELLCASVKV